ncbi:MAG: NfeD family protein [Burkholderiaceae bacterium]|nr:NfeD family protein [Burkholderiaceae bacterium]
MEHWMTWLVWAGILVVLEVFSGTFYLLMVALGFATGALAAWLGASETVQVVLAAVVGVAATYALRKSKYGKLAKGDAARDPNVNLDIGQILNIGEWKNPQGEQYVARVMYRGAMWDVQLERHAEPRPGLFTIREIQGSRLIVSNSAMHTK